MYSYTKKNMLGEESINIHECTNNRHEVAKHTHEFLEFVYILKGSGVHYIDGAKHTVGKGDLLFINYGQTHSIEPSDDMHFVNILLEPSFLCNSLINEESIVNMFQSSLFEEFYGAECDYTNQCVSFDASERDDNDRLIGAMITEFKEKRIGYRAVLRSSMTILFTRLMRKLSDRNGMISACENNDSINEVLEYIDENCANKISLESLAAECFYNPSYFGRLLKERCGKSFTAYVKERRLDKAATLLRAEDYPVDKIMNLAGYNDKKLFYRHFKEMYGMTPSEYRNTKNEK